MVLKFSSVEKKIQNTLCSARKINKKELYHFTQTWRNDRYTFEDETPESLLMRTTSVSQKKKATPLPACICNHNPYGHCIKVWCHWWMLTLDGPPTGTMKITWLRHNYFKQPAIITHTAQWIIWRVNKLVSIHNSNTTQRWGPRAQEWELLLGLTK